MNTEECEALRDISVTVARGVGDFLKHRIYKAHEIETKDSPDDYVTETDRQAEQMVGSELQLARPDDEIIGEEGFHKPGTTGVQWVIDPLDGTGNFILGAHPFVTSIAARFEGTTVAAAVYDPLLDEMFEAVLDGGARMNGRLLHCSTDRPLASSIVATAFDRSKDSTIKARQGSVIARLTAAPSSVADFRRSGAAVYDLCCVATNRVGGYFYNGLKPWDLYAGALIAVEAGATVVGLNGEPAQPHEPVVASAPEIAVDLQQALVDAGFART